MANTKSLRFVYDGWDGFHRSLVEAVRPLTADQLSFRSTEEMRSIGELIFHIAHGRVDWFRRIQAPGAEELETQMASRAGGVPCDAAELVEWLERTWKPVQALLNAWTVDDLAETYHHRYQGVTYAVSRQWTVWRILTHDVYHGGQLSELLAMQGIVPLELTILGGHLTEPETVK